MLLHIINKCNIILSGISSCILFVWKGNNLMFGACLEPVSVLFFHFFQRLFSNSIFHMCHTEIDFKPSSS
jgi:hypothetical protein